MIEEKKTYLVVGSRAWNRQIFDDEIKGLPGEWHFAGASEDLTVENLQRIAPRYVFFLHWSLKVPEEIVNGFECVCFHMTDVPYGRGGSPLQNLIARGHRKTKLTALRMVKDFDAGAVYLKEDLSLEGGTAEEIYIRANRLSAQMIEQIVKREIAPTEQTGDVTIFKRRSPKQSEIGGGEAEDLFALHDFIRMLDADGYPRAYLAHSGFRFEFSRAAIYDGRIVADVRITKLEETEKR